MTNPKASIRSGTLNIQNRVLFRWSNWQMWVFRWPSVTSGADCSFIQLETIRAAEHGQQQSFEFPGTFAADLNSGGLFQDPSVTTMAMSDFFLTIPCSTQGQQHGWIPMTVLSRGTVDQQRRHLLREQRMTPNAYLRGNKPKIKQLSGYWLSSRVALGIGSLVMPSTPLNTIWVLSGPGPLLLSSGEHITRCSLWWVK